jgi:hypothetical protein
MAVKRQIDESEIRLDGSTAYWDINYTGEVEGTYLGTFTFRTSISPIQEIEADRNYRELMGVNPDSSSVRIQNLAFALTQLKQRIISAPPFWADNSLYGGSSVKDTEVIEMVYQAALLAEVKYRNILKARHLEAIEKLRGKLEEQQERARTEQELRES